MARSPELARLFQQPDLPAQRHYEICRSYLCCDEGAGLFAGLNVLPKATYATDYSYKADFRGGVTCLYDTQLLGACLHASESGGRSRPEAVRACQTYQSPSQPRHCACRLCQQWVKSMIAGSLPIGVKRVSWADETWNGRFSSASRSPWSLRRAKWPAGRIGLPMATSLSCLSD